MIFCSFARSLFLVVVLSPTMLLAQVGVMGGTLESIEPGGTAVVVTPFGRLAAQGNKTYKVAPAATITLNGKRARIEQLAPGMRISVYFTGDGLAYKVVARGTARAIVPQTTPLDIPTINPTQPVFPQPGTEEDATIIWPQFRGTDRDNISIETGLLTSWPDAGPDVLWTTRGLGEGYSTVSIANGFIYTMGNQGDSEAFLVIDLQTGKPLWGKKLGPAYKEGQGNGPRGTPSVDATMAYALGATGELAAIDLATRQIRWQKNILSEYGGRNIQWGISESPLLDGDRLVVTPGGNTGTVVCLDKNTGRDIWKAVVPGQPQAGYASVVPMTVGNMKQYIAFTSKGVVGIGARDGRVLWADGTASNGTANCSSPVVYENRVFYASGYGTGGALVQLAAVGNGVQSRVLTKTTDMKNHHGGMVVVDGYVYGTSDPGVLTCIDLRNGQTMWQDRSVGKGAVSCADGHLYVRSERGSVALVEASPNGYREKGRFSQPHRSEKSSWPHPVIADGKLFLRDQDVLICFDLKKP